MAYLVPRFITARRYWQCGPFDVDSAGPVEIHILVCGRDVPSALWALISWYALTQRRDPLCVHEDGTLTGRHLELFRRFFPGCRVIARQEADRAISAHLAAFPRCASYREAHPLALKLFDFAWFARSNSFVIMDADVLLFRPPCPVLRTRLEHEAWAGNLFLRDYQVSYSLGPNEMERLCGGPVAPVNTGFGVICRSTIDAAVIERYLTEAPGMLKNLFWAEQTLYALLSARHGISLLPAQYAVAQGVGLDDVIMKHYVGPLREYFYIEGLPAARRAVRCHGAAGP